MLEVTNLCLYHAPRSPNWSSSFAGSRSPIRRLPGLRSCVGFQAMCSSQEFVAFYDATPEFRDKVVSQLPIYTFEACWLTQLSFRACLVLTWQSRRPNFSQVPLSRQKRRKMTEVNPPHKAGLTPASFCYFALIEE